MQMEGFSEKNRDELCNFLGRYFELSEVNDEDDFFQKGLVNSLFSMQLIVFIEKKFQITMEMEEINPENLSSIHNILAYVQRKQECAG